MNLSSISNKSILGNILRFPLRLLPAEMKVPILQGRLRGKKWIVGASNHGCWLGSYEYPKRKLFEQTVKEGAIVYDLGGHVGFYTLLASSLVGPTGQVFVFEPWPKNIDFIQRHLSINNIHNVSILAVAVSDKSGHIGFSEGTTSSTGTINQNSSFKVEAVTLDDLYSNNRLPLPNVMKIDIEGAEYLAIAGAINVLKTSKPAIFLATHGKNVHQQCCTLLNSIGYKLLAIDDQELTQSSELLAVYSE